MSCPEENEIVDFLRGDLDPAQRDAIEAHLDDCPACCQLVAELARIFRGDSDADVSDEGAPTLGGSLSAPVSSLASRESTAPHLPEGAKLGRYVVLHRVGAGGMGVVYAAYDPELDRKVALKLLMGGGPGSSPKVQADQRTRLLREAQAMAKLSHPNVITVHDVGTFEGQVFMAMEFVEGSTLKHWLRAKTRPWREVMRVFLAAGRGLAAAHAAALVHRDFKPDNVLLSCSSDEEPDRILVTDFGLARPVRGSTDAFAAVSTLQSGQQVLTAQLTQTGALVGTPAYMAPEQMSGERIDVLSDQFSFCVALYEGLYGERPFPGKAFGELVANVADGRIRPPPRDTKVPRWVRRAILRGLSTQASDRHASVDALLAQLERDPWRPWRRLAMLVLPATTLGVGLFAYQRDVEPDRDSFCRNVEQRLEGAWDADRRQAMLTAFEDTDTPFATDAFDATSRALDDYTRNWAGLQREACQAQLDGSVPEAVLALRMSCLERQVERMRAVTDVLVDADAGTVERALDTVHRLPDPALCRDVERITARLGPLGARSDGEIEADKLVSRGRVLRDAGRYAEALDTAQSALARARAAESGRAEAEALEIAAASLDLSGKIDEAERGYHDALTAALRFDHSEVVARAAIGLVWLSRTADRRMVDAERWAKHGLAALTRIGGDPELHAQIVNALGMAYLGHERFDEAEQQFRRALQIREEAFGPDHVSLAEPLNAMGQLMGQRAEVQRAQEYFERARELMEREYGPRHPSTAAAIENLGATAGQMGDYTNARLLHEEALAIRTAALGPDHPDNGASHHNIALTLLRQGRLEEALSHNLKALAIYERVRGPVHLDVAVAQAAIGSIELERGRFEDAATRYRKAIEIAESLVDRPTAMVARYQLRLADCHAALGDVAQARELMETALETRERVLGPDHPDVARSLESMARMLLDVAHSPTEALVAAERALQIDTAHPDTDPSNEAHTAFLVARSLWETSTDPVDRQRALSLAEQARSTLGGAGSGRDDELAVVEDWLSRHTR